MLSVCTQALFGNADYEDVYKGYLVYAGSGTFTDVNQTNARFGCGEYDVSSNSAWAALRKDDEVLNVILMVDRNPVDGTDCTFSEKVWRAQLANAKVSAVIVADTRDNTQWPTYMRGDSNARNINMPSLFMPKEYSDAIRTAVQDPDYVNDTKAFFVALEYFLPNPDGRVEYDLYYNILNPKTIPFLTSYGAVARVLKQRAHFTPHWSVEDATQQCSASKPSFPSCATNCLMTPMSTGSSRYYCLRPDNSKTSLLTNITGQQALNETLRQQCIWTQTASTSTSLCPNGNCQAYPNWVSWTYWYYIEQFYSTCVSPSLPASRRFSEQCSQDAVAYLNQKVSSLRPAFQVNWQQVKTCADWATNSLNTSARIALLDQQITLWSNQGPWIEPMLYVNMIPYNGDVTCSTPITEGGCGITSMMCYGYANDTAYPIECNYPNNCPFGSPSCSGTAVTTTGSTGISAGAVVGIVLAFLFIGAVIGYYFHKKSQDRTRIEVDQLLKQYLPMDPGQTHGVAQGSTKLREQHERRLMQDMDLEDQEAETSDEV